MTASATVKLPPLHVTQEDGTHFEDYHFDAGRAFIRVERIDNEAYWSLNIDTVTAVSSRDEQIEQARAVLRAAEALIHLNGGNA